MVLICEPKEHEPFNKQLLPHRSIKHPAKTSLLNQSSFITYSSKDD